MRLGREERRHHRWTEDVVDACVFCFERRDAVLLFLTRLADLRLELVKAAAERKSISAVQNVYHGILSPVEVVANGTRRRPTRLGRHCKT
jgi:hypothetical protein